MELYSSSRQRREDEAKGRLSLAVVLFLALAFGAYSVRAEGLRFEFLGGQCQQDRSGKGSWWNDHYPTSIDLVDGCHQIGFSATPWHWMGFDFGTRLAYVNLGRTTTDSIMGLWDDEQLSNHNGVNCDWSNRGRGCLIRVSGGGRARGFSFGGVIERDFGDTTVGLEAGGFAYYNHFTVYVRSHPDGGENYFMRWDMARGWAGTAYLGANVRTDVRIADWRPIGLMASVRTYAKITAHQSGCEGCSGTTNGEAWQVNFGLSIPVTL